MADIGKALAYLFPNARPLVDYEVWDQGAGPYIAVWRLAQSQPTAAQIAAAITASDAAQATQATEAAALRQQVVTLAQGTVGQSIATLTAAQVRALLALLLYKAGAITAQGMVKPLGEWIDGS